MQNIESLFMRYKDDVYRLALSYTKSVQEAEDVCQTVFVKLMEQKHIQPEKERAWLMQVTANRCKNLLRSSWWKQTAALEDALPSEEPGYPEIRGIVMDLPPKYRVVVYLHYYEELSTGEMARLLHISQSAVTTRLSRARKLLKEQLQEVAL